ncbi:MAG: type II CAAX endopeptidase family protein [Candidatus Saccharimonadales bacterium]
MPHLAENRDFWKNPVVVILSSVVLYFTAQLLGLAIILPFIRFSPSKNAQSMLLLIGVFVAFLILLTTGMKLLRFRWRDIGVSAGKLRYVGLVPVAFALYIVASSLLMSVAQQIPGFNSDQAQDIGLAASGGHSTILAFVVLVVITPLFEEMLFRGVLFHGLRKRLPLVVSAFITSFAFALAHGQANVAVDTFALGILLCLLAEYSKSLLPAVLLHALKNFLAFGVLFLHWGK